MEDLDLALVSPHYEARRGGSVMLRLPEKIDACALIDKLRAADVYADCPGLTLRLSPGSMTTIDGVERLFFNLEGEPRTGARRKRVGQFRCYVGRS